MNRRQVILGLAAAALPPGGAQAALQCSGFDNFGVQQCTAGIEIDTPVLAQQQCPAWCWAACIQGGFRLHGHEVEQADIVRRSFGQLVCQTASGVQIVNTINGQWTDRAGRSFSAQASPLLDITMGVWNPQAAAMVATELANGQPLINGALGHATILTAMTYMVDGYGRGQPTQIIVRDPWPGNVNRRPLTPQEANGTFFIARVSVN